ncbi:MAG: hypothetical protein QNJ47_12565 [Nostocaceae cyanobacterium]|nr:hypothetical protein [Nostocaceae cyanobacterium]
MENFDAHQVSPEIESLVEVLNQGKGIAEITQLIQHSVQHQIEIQLTEFQEAIAQTNLAVIDAMHQELTSLKAESATLHGVMERLKTAVTPDLSGCDDEVVSFRQAIDNLEKYGSIIPSNSDIAATQSRFQKNHAWSLVRQSLVKFLIVKLEKMLGNRTIS